MSSLTLQLTPGHDPLSVRSFDVRERMSGLFEVTVTAVAEQPSLDLDAAAGHPARFSITSGLAHGFAGARLWEGLCTSVEQLRAEPDGLSTYSLVIAPWMWRLTQRRNCRLFQHVRIPDIVETLLQEWDIDHEWRIDPGAYPALELRTQFEESDHAFVCRLLEEAGISFHFLGDVATSSSRLILTDRPGAAGPRLPPLPFVDSPGQAHAGNIEHVTGVHLRRDVRPGRHTISDFDFRRPGYPLAASAGPAPEPESRYEQLHYAPDAALHESAPVPGPTPVADDLGMARSGQPFLDRRAALALEETRASRRSVTFRTNALDLHPGSVLTIEGHPHALLSSSTRLLVLDLHARGTHDGEWHVDLRAHFADEPHRPPRETPRPRIFGQQSAVVVGPPGEEIYTDEYGRVRVQFHWDREGRRDPRSSAWMRVSQGWAGAGYGMFTIPRVGHEVLVAFLGGDPDCPMVCGRLFNGTAAVPYKLPENRTVSTWKSDSSPGAQGFNEIRFEDARGREHVYVQAERDLGTLVKNDEMAVVGNDHTRVVRHDEMVNVGNDHTRVVQNTHTEVTGLHSMSTTGVNRTAAVGADDTTLVGSKWSVTVARGLTGKLTRELEKVLGGPLGSVLRGPLAGVLGLIPAHPLGGVMDWLSQYGPVRTIAGFVPDAFRDVLDLPTMGFAHDPGPPPTSIEMVDRKIVLTTGEASIILEGPNITLMADGNIMLQAKGDAGVLADRELALGSVKDAVLTSTEGAVHVRGAPFVHLNPEVPGYRSAGAAPAGEEPGEEEPRSSLDSADPGGETGLDEPATAVDPGDEPVFPAGEGPFWIGLAEIDHPLCRLTSVVALGRGEGAHGYGVRRREVPLVDTLLGHADHDLKPDAMDLVQIPHRLVRWFELPPEDEPLAAHIAAELGRILRGAVPGLYGAAAGANFFNVSPDAFDRLYRMCDGATLRQGAVDLSTNIE